MTWIIIVGIMTSKGHDKEAEVDITDVERRIYTTSIGSIVTNDLLPWFS
jgi:hypothetical protein